MSSVQTAPCPVFTMRQPYQRPGYSHPSEVTQHLRNNLIAIQERHRRRRTTNAQVEQNGSANRNSGTPEPHGEQRSRRVQLPCSLAKACPQLIYPGGLG